MPLFPNRLPTKVLPRSDFDPEGFRALHVRRGKDVVWEMAGMCPCAVRLSQVTTKDGYPIALTAPEVTREARLDCPQCSGQGWYLHSAQTIRVLLHDMASNPKLFGVSGDYAAGRSIISFLPENKPSIGDRVTLPTAVQRVTDLTRRVNANTQALRFPIVSEVLDLATGPTPVRIVQAIKAGADNVVQAGSAMVEGIDFSVDNTGKVSWLAGPQTPTVGAWFSITYFAHQRYKVEDTPYAARNSERHHKSVAPVITVMPIRATAMQEWRGDGANQAQW